jgi:four helix bundle protein
VAKIEKFHDLDVWKKSREITKLIYEATSNEKFRNDSALCDQIRQNSISVGSNIAEGFGRESRKEFVQFLCIAKGLCNVVVAQLYVALDQDYLAEREFFEISKKLEKAGRMIRGLIKYLQQSDLRGNKFK